MTLAPEASAVVASDGGEELALARSLDGHASLSVRPASATVEQARWTEDGTLELAGEIRAPGEADELLLVGRSTCAATRSRCTRTGRPGASAPG